MPALPPPANLCSLVVWSGVLFGVRSRYTIFRWAHTAGVRKGIEQACHACLAVWCGSSKSSFQKPLTT
uniref:Putative secreted protein n=1 Tax=Anopheles darlingi TaxID=43151 RepID=A0A2M4D4D3_ANODA